MKRISEYDQRKYQLLIPLISGMCVAFLLLQTFSLPKKYEPAAILFLLIAPIILVVDNKEKMFLAAFLFLLPLDLGQKLVQRYEMSSSKVPMLFKFYLVDIFLIGVFIFWLMKVSNKRYQKVFSIKQDKTSTPMFLWIGMGILSVIPAVDRMAAALEVLNMLRIFLILLLIFHYYKGFKDLDFIVRWLALGYFAQSILVIAQYATNSLLIDMPGTSIGFDIVEQGVRPTGTMGHSGHFAKYSGMMLSLIFSYAVFSNKVKDKALYSLIWLIGSIALVLTISRAGIVTWILSIPAFFIGLFALKIISKKKVFRMSLAFGLTLCLALGTIYLAAGRRLLGRMHEDSGSAAMRMPTFKVALNVIKYNPILGVGLKNYILRHQEYDTTKERISVRLPFSQVHNLFLLYASEIGIPGLLFFLWFLWGLLKNSLFCAKYGDNTTSQVAFLGIMLGVSSLVIQSMTGKGVIDRIIHLSIIAVFAGISAKQAVCLGKKRACLEHGVNI